MVNKILVDNNVKQAGAELCQAQNKLCLVRLLLTYLVWIFSIAFTHLSLLLLKVWFRRLGLVGLDW